ncbi:MAG: hypothetical protein ACTSWN_04645 [Promethearchaeota archaeon]
MDEPFPELSELERNFLDIFENLFADGKDEIDDGMVTDFSGQIAVYNRNLNKAMQEYAKIDYFSDPEKKENAKAFIKYGYNFLDLLIDILKYLNIYKEMPDPVLKRIGLLESFIKLKEKLIRDEYLPAAQEELIHFHDSNIRNMLEHQLSSRLEELSDKKQDDKDHK